ADQRGEAAKLELERQTGGDAVEDGLTLGATRQVLPGLFVGVQDQLVEVLVEEQRYDERDEHDHRGAEQPGPELTQVVGQRHPPIRADRMLRAPAEETRKAL